MTIARLNDRLSVSPQVELDDLPGIAAQGFKTLICNRPDGEAAMQPTHQQIADAAAAHGLRLHYLPVIPGQVEDASAKAFGELLSSDAGPLLAYCRTGPASIP